MVKLNFLLLILILSSLIQAADVNQEMFKEAIDSFEKREFSRALELFKSIENQGIVNADLFYNMGNCYFRLSDLGAAILYYKRSLKIQPNHEAARRNLTYALTLTRNKQTPETENVIRSFWQRTYDSLSINLLAALLLIFWIMLNLMIIMMIFHYRGRDKTIPMFFTTIIILFIIITAILSYTKWHGFHNVKEAVLIYPTTIGYSGPSEDYTRVFTIHEGMIFVVVRQEEDWALIKLTNGLGGWIPRKAFEII